MEDCLSNDEPRHVKEIDSERGITHYTDGSMVVDIGPDSPSYIAWQKDQEERVYPKLRLDLKKQLNEVCYGLNPDGGPYYSINLKVYTRRYPEATKMLEALLRQLREDTKDTPEEEADQRARIKASIPRFLEWFNSPIPDNND